MSETKRIKLDILLNDSNDNSKETEIHKNVMNSIPNKEDYFSEQFLKIELNLSSKISKLSFKSPVDYVYNPIEYAFFTHSIYVRKYCTSTKKVLFLGMNPGPWGMSQTGVPFGEVKLVRDWLKIEGDVKKPEKELSVRPITGFKCSRSEVSGKRFWTFFQNLCGTPENFFKYAYVHNYCPVALMQKSGKNITPSDLKNTELKSTLIDLCDESLCRVIELLQIETVIGIGGFAQTRAEEVIKKNNLKNISVAYLIHPSPIIPRNGDWHEKATKVLTENKLIHLFQNN